MISLRAELSTDYTDNGGVQGWNKEKQGGWGSRPARGKGEVYLSLYNSNPSIVFPTLDLTILRA
jgi:hypothetical protein